jgi:hypothetical protein
MGEKGNVFIVLVGLPVGKSTRNTWTLVGDNIKMGYREIVGGGMD